MNGPLLFLKAYTQGKYKIQSENLFPLLGGVVNKIKKRGQLEKKVYEDGASYNIGSGIRWGKFE